MARALSKVAQKYVTKPNLVLKNRARDYTPEPGSHGRGESIYLYDCNSCEHGEHQECENYQLILCRCWRTKHTSPPPPRGRVPARRPKEEVVVNDDEIEWEDEIEADEWDDA